MEIASFCRTFNCLPRAGGLLDQDPILMLGMMMVIDAWHEREELEAKRGASNKRA